MGGIALTTKTMNKTPPSSYRVCSLLGFKEKTALKLDLKDKQYSEKYGF